MEQVLTQLRGDVGGAGPLDDGESEIADMGQVQRGVAGADAAAIFAQRHVADVEAGVLDPPVVPPELKQLLRGEPADGHAGHGITDRAGLAAVTGDHPLQTEDLLQARPAPQAQTLHGRDRERAALEPPMAFRDRLSLPSPGLALFESVGGKSLSSLERRSGHLGAVAAGCL